MSSFYTESPRPLPVVKETDVIVAGGGPAGIAAAISAARAGARVTLLETQGCLGGVWTAGLLSFIIDGDDQSGVMSELLRRMALLQGTPLQFCSSPASAERPRRGVTYSAETMKVALDGFCIEAGVEVRLYTRVVAAVRGCGGNLAMVITESKSGREAWKAAVFIDCTGDGDLAAQAGCGFDMGRAGRGDTQPMSLMGLVTGLNYNDVAAFVTGGRRDHSTGKLMLLNELRRAGVEPSYIQPSLFHIQGQLFALMANHAYGFSGTDAASLTEATIESRREVFNVVQALRRLGGVWRGAELAATGAHIGVREGRRIQGLYTVTKDDVTGGARHTDAVCRVTFPVDIHATSANAGKGYSNNGVTAQPYDIPLRALIARDVVGLLLAGRCISGDFFAHASYRVTGYAVELGEAAGRTAAWCVRTGKSTHEADWRGITADADGIPCPAIMIGAADS